MRHGLVVALTGASVIALGLAGCSSEKGGSNTGKGAVTFDGGVMTQHATSTVTIDGQPHKVEGRMACTVLDDDVVITLGSGRQTVKASLSTGDSPVVSSVNMEVDGYGLVASVVPNAGEAKATKDGKTYTISGTGIGTDPAYVSVTKPFEVELTCP